MTEQEFNTAVDNFDLANQVDFNNGVVGHGAVHPTGNLGAGVSSMDVNDAVTFWENLDDAEKETLIGSRSGGSSKTILGWGIGCPCEGD